MHNKHLKFKFSAQSFMHHGIIQQTSTQAVITVALRAPLCIVLKLKIDIIIGSYKETHDFCLQET